MARGKHRLRAITPHKNEKERIKASPIREESVTFPPDYRKQKGWPQSLSPLYQEKKKIGEPLNSRTVR